MKRNTGRPRRVNAAKKEFGGRKDRTPVTLIDLLIYEAEQEIINERLLAKRAREAAKAASEPPDAETPE